MMALMESIEKRIKQNNAINIYGDYFKEEEDENTHWEESYMLIAASMKDPEKIARPVSDLSLNHGENHRVAVSYCSWHFQGMEPSTPTYFCCFQMEDPRKPVVTLESPDYVTTIAYSAKESYLLAGGCYEGCIAFWDDRISGGPQGITGIEQSHKERVSKVLWTSNKSEIFTGSADGTVKWWDIRKFGTPLNSLVMDLQYGDVDNAQRVSCLEYDPTIPMKFMVATEAGNVYRFYRKGISTTEHETTYKAHYGSVYSVERNPSFPKQFLTVGDWSTRIWCEDVQEGNIIWTSWQTEQVTFGRWSPTRPSVLLTARNDGVLDCWDLLYGHKTPALAKKLSQQPIRTLEMSQNGLTAVAGCDAGVVTVVIMSQDLATCTRTERMNIGSMFEREARRERLVEARSKGIKFSQGQKQTDNEGTDEAPSGESSEKEADSIKDDEGKVSAGDKQIWSEKERNILQKTEEDYFTIIKNVKEERLKYCDLPDLCDKSD